MTNREAFIKLIQTEIFDRADIYTENDAELFTAAQKYFETLKNMPTKEPKIITENGAAILKFVQENKDTYNNIFTSKSLGEAIGLGSKVVSGSMRKLVADGFFEKVGANPVSYSITDKGLNFNSFDN